VKSFGVDNQIADQASRRTPAHPTATGTTGVRWTVAPNMFAVISQTRIRRDGRRAIADDQRNVRGGAMVLGASEKV